MPNYKVIDADKLDSDLTMLADGIRAKIGTTAPLHFPDEMSEAIRTRGAKIVPKTIEANGEYYAEEDGADGYSPLTINVGDAELESFIVGDTTELTLRTVTEIKNARFQRNTKITKLTAHKVEKIGSLAFNLSDIVSVSAPKLKEIGDSAFKESDIQTLDAPQLELIGMWAFQDCPNLILESLPQSIHTISSEAFNGCYKVKISEFPESIKYIYRNVFSTAPATITFKGIPDTIDSTAFAYAAHAIQTINVPWSEYWVGGAPWGATNATINYDVFEQEIPLQGTWRFKERFDEGDEVLGPAKSRDDGEVRRWYADFEFTSNGKEFLAIEWDDDLAYIDAEGEYHYVTEYVEDEEGNGHWVWTDEAYRDVVTTSGWYFYVENTYDGIGVPYFYFYRWMTNNAEKL